MTLKELAAGKTARIISVGGEGALRQHFLDMGVIPGAEIAFIKYAPMGDPMEFMLHGYELTLRVADAEKIEIADNSLRDTSGTTGILIPETGKGESDKAAAPGRVHHPGYGEGGIFHDPKHENPLPEGTALSFALAGNQNCGKTTLFNQLTGSNQHVGNFPGVTVSRKSGVIRNHPDTEVVDLPGIYSLSPYTSEEIISRQYILREQPKGIINIVDATNIERNLYLTMQLMELDVPIVLAVNMMDELRGNGGSIRINVMEEMLGIPVIPITASKNEGVDELVDHAIHVAKYQESPGIKDFCDENDHGGTVHRCLHAIMHLIQDHADRAKLPVRFAANKVIEGDPRVIRALQLTQNEQEMVEHIILQMEEERGLDRAAAIADMRFSFIEKVVRASVVKPVQSKERERSERIDRILTGKYTAIPAFIGIMALVFVLTFNVIGAWLQGLMEQGVTFVTEKVDQLMNSMGVNEVLHSLVTEGILPGVGTVLSFMPIILVLFFFLSLLEDTGYMARVAFVTDKPLRKLGLSGRSIVPMLIGFGCSVPGIMSSRTLPSERDRKLTILLIPFMSCTAKLPIYGFIVSSLFPGRGGLIITGIYCFGILMGILMALVSKKTVLRGEAVPFVMELPNYRLPGARNVLRLIWEKARDFLVRAFTVIFVATIVIWFLGSFDFSFNMVPKSRSILTKISGWITPVFAPLGFGDWRIVTALITGFMAKESVVSTLQVLLAGAPLLTILSPEAGLPLLTFCLLYTPCVAAIASVKRELGRKWAVSMVGLQCLIAWIMAFLVKLVTGLFA